MYTMYAHAFFLPIHCVSALQKDVIQKCFLPSFFTDIVHTISVLKIYQKKWKHIKNKWLPTSFN